MVQWCRPIRVVHKLGPEYEKSDVLRGLDVTGQMERRGMATYIPLPMSGHEQGDADPPSVVRGCRASRCQGQKGTATLDEAERQV